jgi:phosphate starvation-inducible protein PhoH/intein/homing endonuclease
LAENAAEPVTLRFPDPRLFRELLGQHDEHLKTLERQAGVRLEAHDGTIALHGDPLERELVGRVLTQLYGVLESGYPIYASDVDYAFRILSSDRNAKLRDIFLDTVFISAHKRVITPKSIGQKQYIDAIRNYDIVFGIGPAGTGKCIAASSLVLTSAGMAPIGSLGADLSAEESRPIHLGVSGLDGVEAASHVYHGGVAATRRIRTRLGFEIEATPEHPLLQLGRDGTLRWRRADELAIGDFVAIQRAQELFGSDTAVDFRYVPNTHRDHAKPVTVDALDEDLAYVLGLLTGDGCLTFRNRVILTSADEDIVVCFRRFAARFGLTVFRNGGGRPYDHIIASAQLYQLLRHLGMSAGKASEKRVPAAVLRAPKAIVAAFLQGLFDTDGTVSRRDGYPSLCSASKPLIDEIQVVLLNFGVVAAKRIRRVRYGGAERTYYDLEMRGREAARFHETIGFRLERKRALRKDAPTNTNVDVVPYVSALVDAAVRGVVLSRALHKRVGDYRSGRRQPSYEKIADILALLRATHAANDACRQLETLYARHLFWAEIAEIEPSEAPVYDLTVPGTHSFCANGFVNHNTYLAMAMAVAELMKNSFSRIILTRPAVEAGEKLGFLPGDLAEKVNPYLRPLYDALHDMVDFDRARRMVERGTIEVAPLAFMRGRTLNDSFVILDEAQNTTTEQMKMFLTRLGYGSKAIITGDVTQTDLPAGKQSGLKEAAQVLRHVAGIQFQYFTERDVVRHPLVQEIITAYDRAEPREAR